MRRHQTEMGQIFPDRFIPIAEETGLIVPLGEWALQEGLRAGHALGGDGAARDEGRGQHHRPAALSAGRLPAQVELAAAAPAMRGSLVLELTEGVLIDSSNEVSSQLQRFRELGVQLSIDDFGTGCSSMNYLKNFPLDELKIDRSFVKGLPDQRADRGHRARHDGTRPQPGHAHRGRRRGDARAARQPRRGRDRPDPGLPHRQAHGRPTSSARWRARSARAPLRGLGGVDGGRCGHRSRLGRCRRRGGACPDVHGSGIGLRTFRS
jgi:hypothetical protein